MMLVQCVVARIHNRLALVRAQLSLMRNKLTQVLLRVGVRLSVLTCERLVHLILLVVANRVQVLPLQATELLLL